MSANQPSPLPAAIQNGRYLVRPLGPEDFTHLQRLEQEIWGNDATGQLCPYYLRLCTDFFPEWSFLALEEGRSALRPAPKGSIAPP